MVDTPFGPGNKTNFDREKLVYTGQNGKVLIDNKNNNNDTAEPIENPR